MIKLRKLPYEQFYTDLKNSFKDGIEFKRAPLNTYLSNRIAGLEIRKENLENIAGDLYVDKNNNMKNILKRIKTFDADWNAVNEIAVSNIARDKIMDSGRSRFENAFMKGIENPDVCLMALYDAVAEWVLNLAGKKAGEKAPIQVIEKEVSQLSSQIFKDEANKEAYDKLIKQFKKLNPKTGRKRLKLIQKSYLLKIENGINEILKSVVTPKN